MMNAELPFVKEMFNTIAPRYDLLNRLLSLRQDVYWRRVLVRQLRPSENKCILDVACGTGDVLLEAARRSGTRSSIVGVDFSPGMLQHAKEKIDATAEAGRIRLMAGDALHLPFRAGVFDAVSIAFGIRNITDKAGALGMFYRCLKDGGTLAVLELTTPPPGAFRSIYFSYFKKILPLVGRLISGDRGAYQYLPESVVNFPESRVFVSIMRAAGFRKIRYRRLTLGIATLYVAEK